MASSPMTGRAGLPPAASTTGAGVLRSGRQGLCMAVAGPNDPIGRARGFHSLGKNKGLSPRWLVSCPGPDRFLRSFDPAAAARRW